MIKTDGAPTIAWSDAPYHRRLHEKMVEPATPEVIPLEPADAEPPKVLPEPVGGEACPAVGGCCTTCKPVPLVVTRISQSYWDVMTEDERKKVLTRFPSVKIGAAK